MSGYLETFTGKKFHFENLAEGSICIEDIAHALSMQCRFNGHVGEFYSVAQHCCLVSNQLPIGHRLQGLLHDVAEAYIGDIVSPFKDKFPRIQEIEDNILRKIFEVFDCPFPLSKEVLEADHRMLYTEFRDLGFLEFQNKKPGTPSPYAITVTPWMQSVAKMQFMRLFTQITEGKLDTHPEPMCTYDLVIESSK